jgi:D-alanyl-D-alanine carboxypeptidase
MLMRATCAALAGLLAFSLGFGGSGGSASAGPAILFDQADGKVLYAEDQDNLWHPASLTKIMTAYLAFEAIKAGKLTLESKLATSELANAQPPSKIGLPVGAEMTVDLALKALIIKSANDVAVMLAEGIGGSQDAFVVQMNATAKRLGMTRTVFVNPNGLPAPDQVTTARDLGKLSRAILKDFPEYVGLWSQPDMRIGRRRISTHNGLLKTYDGADGLKTGFICDSGFNVVATATRDGRKLVAVVLGEITGRERAVRAANLLEHGFQTQGWRTLFQTATVDSLPIATDATTTVTSIRDIIPAWGCGGRRRAPAAVAKVRQKRQEIARQKVAQQQAAAAPAAAGAVATEPAAPVAPAKAAKRAPRPAAAQAPAGEQPAKSSN